MAVTVNFETLESWVEKGRKNFYLSPDAYVISETPAGGIKREEAYSRNYMTMIRKIDFQFIYLIKVSWCNGAIF